MVSDSRGRHALLAAIEELGSQTAFEAKYQARQPQISLVLTRERKPGRKLGVKFAAAGIPADWWDEPPTDEQLRTEATRRARGAA